MSALTSLLVRDQVVPVRKIEEAIQRQVISGGEIEEVLLEMDAAPENVLAAYRAALYGLLPATREEVMTVSRDTLRKVPREVAEQYRLVPLSGEDRTLVVAVASPLSPEVDEQLGFLLGFDIVYRIVTDVRLSAALAHHYNVDASARARRIAEKLRGRDAGTVPYVAPPQEEKIERDSITAIPSKQVGAVIDWDADDEPAPPRPAPRTTKQFGAPQDGSATGSERPTPRARRKFTPPERPSSISSKPPAEVSRTVEVGDAAGGPAVAEAEPTDRPERAAAVAEPADSTKPTDPGRESRRPRYRGPMTARQAVEALAKAPSRDEVLEILFVFARQFFDYTALFVVHDDRAEGRDAYGSGPSRDVVAGIAIPLDVPGTFGSVRSTLETRVVDLRENELDRIVAGDLQRAEAQPYIVFPITIRGRAVLMLYGDQGGAPFLAADVPELVGLLPRVGEAFERIILSKKYAGYAEPSREDRTTLKSAVTRLSSPAAPPPGGEDGGAGAYRPSQSPEGRRVRRRKRSAPLDVLKVPRSAPPPPLADEPDEPGEADEPAARPTPSEVERRARDVDYSKTHPDGHAALAQAARRAAQLADLDAPDAPVEDYDEDPLPDSPVDRPPVNRSEPVADSSYSLQNVGVDRVSAPAPKQDEQAVEPEPRRRRTSTRARDARREEDGSSVSHDVVRLPSAAASIRPAASVISGSTRLEPTPLPRARREV